VTLRLEKRLWDRQRELTIVAGAEEERSLDHFSDFGKQRTLRTAWNLSRVRRTQAPRWPPSVAPGSGTHILTAPTFLIFLNQLAPQRTIPLGHGRGEESGVC
jgi:hypothetical protein